MNGREMAIDDEDVDDDEENEKRLNSLQKDSLEHEGDSPIEWCDRCPPGRRTYYGRSGRACRRARRQLARAAAAADRVRTIARVAP